MDILFFKIFRNIFLFKKIFSFVKGSRFGFTALKRKPISVILEDKKLLGQYYQSYVYNKSISNKNGIKNEYDSILYFMIEDPTTITYEMFKTLYCDNLDYYESKTERLMKWYFSFSDNIKIIQYLIEQCSLKIFTLSNIRDEKKYMKNLESYILFLSKNKIYNSISCSSYNSSNSSCTSYSNSNSNSSEIISTRLEILNYLIEIFKKETNKSINKKIELSYEVLLESLDFNCEIEYHERLFKLCLNDLKKSEIYIARFLGKLIKTGNLEMTELYIKEFKNFQCTYEYEIESFATKTTNNSILGDGVLDLIYKSLKNSISVFIKLVKNNNIRFNEFRQLNKFFYLNQLSIEDYYQVIEYCNEKRLPKGVDAESSQINKIPNLKTLIYLIENKNSFTPNLSFDRGYLLLYTTKISKDFDSFKFILDPKNQSHFKGNGVINLNSSYQIVKYSLENLTNFHLYMIDGDILFLDVYLTNSYCGDKEFVKYIIQKRIENSDSFPPIQLTYRSLDRVCLNGQTELARLFIENEPILKIGISRDAINNAIQSGNLEIVELLKNVEITKPGEIKVIQESSIYYIVDNYRNDIFDSLLNMNQDFIDYLEEIVSKGSKVFNLDGFAGIDRNSEGAGLATFRHNTFLDTFVCHNKTGKEIPLLLIEHWLELNT
ncbi:hypothetical protein ACTFIY_004121 [Dictyostelium cf. discoideum]